MLSKQTIHAMMDALMDARYRGRNINCEYQTKLFRIRDVNGNIIPYDELDFSFDTDGFLIFNGNDGNLIYCACTDDEVMILVNKINNDEI